MNFLEARRFDKGVPVAIRTGIGEILKEARQHMRDKRLALDGFQELQEVYARRLAKEKEEAIHTAKEHADVMMSVRMYYKKKATTEVEDLETLSRKLYRKNIPRRRRRALRKRNRLVRYAVVLAVIGACEQVIVGSSKAGDASRGLLALAVLFYVASICLVVYAHYYLGPKSIRPWRPTEPSVLSESIELRMNDLLAKWENEQKQKRLETKHHKEHKTAERQLAQEAGTMARAKDTGSREDARR